MESKRFKVNSEDINKWLKNSAIFMAPFALVFLTAVKSGTPLKDALIVLYLYALDVFIDLLRKFIAGK